ncbi:MAG: zf-HC2 domain-containing protein [Verrucomicrobia subdivision 3 bacterium]|nr:zf-HC2 domain-containing protein [Limisphaerales bacterium]
MKCEELLAMLNESVNGVLDPSVCREFEQHLAGCSPCRGVVDNVRKTIILYQAGHPCELPRAFQERLHAALRERWKEPMRANHPTNGLPTNDQNHENPNCLSSCKHPLPR